MRRRKALFVCVVTAVFLSGAVGCVQTERDDSSEIATVPPTDDVADGEQLLYLQRTTLKRFDIDSGETTIVRELPSADVQAAPGAPLLAYLSEGPSLTVLNLASEDEVDLGPGVAPLWKPGGGRIAFLRPAPGSCVEEGCPPLRAEVVLADPETGAPVTLLPRGRWSLLAWAGDDLLAFDARTLEVFALDASGEQTPLGLEPSEFWDASPDGSWMVRVGERGTVFAPRADRATGSIAVPIQGRLADGEWSPDGERVAAVVLRRARSHAVVFSPGQPEPVALPGSQGAAGNVVWSDDGDAVALARVDPSAGGRLEAIHCSVVDAPRCVSLFSWRRSITLLQLGSGAP